MWWLGNETFEERCLYKFLSKHVTEYISQTEKESTVKDQISTHLLRGDRSHSQHFQGAAHCSLMDQFQTFPLPSVITAAQASPLPLSGHVFR